MYILGTASSSSPSILASPHSPTGPEPSSTHAITCYYISIHLIPTLAFSSRVFLTRHEDVRCVQESARCDLPSSCLCEYIYINDIPRHVQQDMASSKSSRTKKEQNKKTRTLSESKTPVLVLRMHNNQKTIHYRTRVFFAPLFPTMYIALSSRQHGVVHFQS